MVKRSYLVAIGLIAALTLPVFALGATLKGGESVTIGAGEKVYDNAYLAGRKVFVGGSVFGDVLAAGADVVVSKDVSDDVALAGAKVTMLGSTGGDMRIAGADVLVSGSAGGDLLVAGAAVNVLPEVTVGKDALVVGGDVTMDGVVRGDARIVGRKVEIGGTIDGNVTVEGGQIVIKSGATIRGSVVYKGANENILTVEDGATIVGNTVYEKGQLTGLEHGSFKNTLFAFFGTILLIKFVTMLLVGILAVVFLPKLSRGIVRGALERKGRSFLWGLLAIIVVPILTILLFVSVVGAMLGFMLLLTYLLMLALSGVYGGVLLGSWIGKFLQKETHAIVADWKYTLLGMIVLFIFALIPVIGWLVALYVVALALGSMLSGLYRSVWLERK